MKRTYNHLLFTLALCLCSVFTFAQDCQGGQSMACKSNLNVSLDESCSALITPYVFLVSPDAVETAYTVTVTDPTGNVQTGSGATISGKGVYTVSVAHCNGNSCWGYVTAEDKLAPTLACPPTRVISCNEDPRPSYPDDYPVASDNCGITASPETITYTSTGGGDPCAASQVISYIFTGVDDCGNVSQPCVSNVVIERPDIDGVVFPGDIEVECTGADSVDPADLNSYPTLGGQVFEIGTKICNYAVTYTDTNPIELCGNTFKVIRNWSIVDWCGDEVRSGLQIIKVTDTIAPAITCPSAVVVPANFTSCDATVQIQAPEYLETCSSPVTFNVTLPDGSAGAIGQTVSVSAGADYVVTFTATDACGNTSDACTQTYTVVDETGPVAICDQFTVASLGTNGNAHVCATTIDDGSYDNCSDDLAIKVKRMDAEALVGFEDCVDFDCTDGIVTVRMRVYDVVGDFTENDANGRYSECMVQVEVQDKIEATIVCPPNKVVDCMASTGTDAQGVATGTDNCDDVTITYENNENINDCGEGVIFRVWSIEGTDVKCTQRINVERGDAQFFTGDSVVGDDDNIVWPENVALTCDSNNENGSQTEATADAAGFPTLVGTNDDCANLFIGHEDQVLFNDPNACFTIIRTWKVIDWCQFDPNSNDNTGVWTRIQSIKVNDNTAPVISGCEDVLLGDADGSCSENYNLVIGGQDNCSSLNYVYQVDLDSDGTVDFGGSGLNDNYDFHVGTHSIHWTVTDDCGNATACIQDLKVVDTKKPTPVCIVSLSTVVMPASGSVTIWDNDFNSGSSFDDCSSPLEFAVNNIGSFGLLDTPPTHGNGELVHSVDFTCNQLGEQLIQMWVIDAAGNFDYCITSIFIQNTGACNDVPAANVANVAGVIETEMQEEVEDVMVDISGGAGNPFMTSNSGLYEFLGLPTNNNYVLTPEKDVNHLNGVTTYDLVLISQHILGAQLLDTPYKIIAADANSSGSVTTLDLVNIRRVILNIDTEFSNNTAWRFVDMDFVFPNPANPFQTTFPEVISLNNFSNDEMAADFVAVKIGDVNASATPNNLLGSQTRNTNGTLALNVDDAKITANDEFTVDFTAKDFNNILGYQFTLNYDQDAVEFVNVEAGKLDVNDANFGFSMTENGMITTSWNDASAISAKDGAVLFSMTFQANTDVQLSTILSATSNVTKAEAYNANLDLFDVAIEFNTTEGTVVAGEKFELFQNTPNPVRENTVISFSLPTASSATLTIMDVSGRTLKVLNGDYAQGYNQVTIDRAELSGTGVLYYQLDTPTDTASKKMILVD